MTLLILMPTLVLLLTLILSSLTQRPRKFLWWFLRVNLVPIICSCCAFYLIAFQPDVPLDYDERVDPDHGRMNFMAALVWGLVLPVAYLMAALPITMAWVFWMRRK